MTKASRKVFCRKYQEELDGLFAPPFPGPTGQDIFENISKRAWDEWQAHQTRLINEKGLSTINPEDRKYLLAEMKKYFNNEEFEQAEGYVPEDKQD